MVTHQIRPDDHLLREAEDAQSSPLQRSVEDVARVRNHVLALENPKQ
jgi:hypothetical protein